MDIVWGYQLETFYFASLHHVFYVIVLQQLVRIIETL